MKEKATISKKIKLLKDAKQKKKMKRKATISEKMELDDMAKDGDEKPSLKETRAEN